MGNTRGETTICFSVLAIKQFEMRDQTVYFPGVGKQPTTGVGQTRPAMAVSELSRRAITSLFCTMKSYVEDIVSGAKLGPSYDENPLRRKRGSDCILKGYKTHVDCEHVDARIVC